jgi:hypothetical protein
MPLPGAASTRTSWDISSTNRVVRALGQGTILVWAVPSRTPSTALRPCITSR